MAAHCRHRCTTFGPVTEPARRASNGDEHVEDQVRVLTAGAVDVISEAELRRRLARGRPLRVKLGIDPTASDIHLGFAVVLRKLRQFQDLGHRAVLIIGDFTAQVGDPSGRSATRPRLSADEVERYAATYVEQVRRILDFSPDRIEIRRNSEWLEQLGMADVLRLLGSTTVARMLERDDFSKRYTGGAPISLSEFLYPLLQGYDSVMVEADVELGGTDQLFNNLMGRHLQEQAGQEPQVVLTTPLLEGTSGVQKMSKSLGNVIGIDEPPAEQFGKVMRIPDELMPQWFQLTTGWHPDHVDDVVAHLRDGRLTPVEAKRRLARRIVDLYHGPDAGVHAEGEFDRVFKAHEAPTEVRDAVLPASELDDHGRIRLAKALHLVGLVSSNKEGRRKIEQAGVRIDDRKVTDPDLEVGATDLEGKLVQVGRRPNNFVRVRVR
jgi:tyrosyl-tRNA synthetase